ncbi:MAG: Uracil phosphoribosyltransferase [Alphaproteobacteria bacterium MarineAlpha5_Bin12]|nr:uracil phosphoribosyltransferase [Pelagibacteraceae bacterium]PPR40991.1 MAG: Uracil phosphoribosyltransferase [Alphaproteobacteria bacterium MarineAlpha5_Bin12]|tara:strand:- start:4050 stop:4670 length:621 start_codon:yes stop_codon:yes gene_type:complete
MLTIIKSPFLESKLSILRNKKTNNTIFRRTMDECSYLIAADVLKNIPFKKINVLTPLKKTTGKKIKNRIVLVPILRAGLGLVEGFTRLLPDAERGHIGLYRDEQTYRPVEYLCNLPKAENKFFIVLDPMLATGNSSAAAIKLLSKSGIKLKNIFLVSLLAAPEGIKFLESSYKSLKIFTASKDEKLNSNKFIVPGLGDAGDRYMGT